jgi:hypothetical protein
MLVSYGSQNLIWIINLVIKFGWFTLLDAGNKEVKF